MRYLALATILYGLAVHAAPAAQSQAETTGVGSLEGPEGLCSSSGQYWNGKEYADCGSGLICENNMCGGGRQGTLLPAGVTNPALAPGALASQGIGGADQPTQVKAGQVESVQGTIASGSASDDGATTALAQGGVEQPIDAAVSNTAGTAQPTGDAGGQTSLGGNGQVATSPVTPEASGSGSATDAAQSDGSVGGDGTCVDEPTNQLVLLTKPANDKWKMTGPECKKRPVPAGNRFVAYWNQWAKPDSIPNAKQLEGVTHLVLSFASSDGTEWVEGTFSSATVDQLKAVKPDLKVVGAFGGWNLDSGFAKAASEGKIEELAQAIVDFKDDNKLDGIDLDWEYPVGGGGFYKSCTLGGNHTLPERPYEGDAYVDLMRYIRKIDPEVHLSAAVPARQVDRELAFPKKTVEQMNLCLDEWNLMTYDNMNRRDNITLHHAGKKVTKDVVDYYYFDGVVDKKKMNIGFANYAKYFTLSNPKECSKSAHGLGCPIVLAEDAFGKDTMNSASFPFNIDLNDEYGKTPESYAASTASWAKLQSISEDITRDKDAGASSYVDADKKLFWTWTSPQDIKDTCDEFMSEVGGVMAWSINQDEMGADGGPHLAAMAQCVGAGGGGGSSGTVDGSASVTAGGPTPSEQAST